MTEPSPRGARFPHGDPHSNPTETPPNPSPAADPIDPLDHDDSPPEFQSGGDAERHDEVVSLSVYPDEPNGSATSLAPATSVNSTNKSPRGTPADDPAAYSNGSRPQRPL